MFLRKLIAWEQKKPLVNLPKAITPVMEILKINKNKNQEEYKYEHKIT